MLHGSHLFICEEVILRDDRDGMQFCQNGFNSREKLKLKCIDGKDIKIIGKICASIQMTEECRTNTDIVIPENSPFVII